jgi:cellulose synthase/poly-beta-1,6-N-acetylglucosamine synthase-like glycosyltransferase
MSSISIIVSTTGLPDRLKLLSDLLFSLSRQSIKDFELIVASEVVDAKLLEVFKENFHPCRKHRLIVSGLWNKCKTANKAIKESRGDIVFLLEDDLILKENFIEELVKTFNLDPRIGCVYSRCVWVYPEGLRSRGGLKGFIAKLISKLSIHESVLSKQARKINSYLYEVPVFTMSVACKREALYKAGFYDESINEPISGEDYDLALRIRKAGYKIVQTTKAVSYHLTKQVTKGIVKYGKDPKKLMGAYETDVYFMAKNRDVLRLRNVISHAMYRAIESIAWGVRARNPQTILYGIAGSLKGLLEGIMQ